MRLLCLLILENRNKYWTLGSIWLFACVSYLLQKWCLNNENGHTCLDVVSNNLCKKQGNGQICKQEIHALGEVSPRNTSFVGKIPSLHAPSSDFPRLYHFPI